MLAPSTVRGRNSSYQLHCDARASSLEASSAPAAMHGYLLSVCRFLLAASPWSRCAWAAPLGILFALSRFVLGCFALVLLRAYTATRAVADPWVRSSPVLMRFSSCLCSRLDAVRGMEVDVPAGWSCVSDVACAPGFA